MKVESGHCSSRIYRAKVHGKNKKSFLPGRRPVLTKDSPDIGETSKTEFKGKGKLGHTRTKKP